MWSSASSSASSSADASAWKTFPHEPFPDGFPEGNFVAVHCSVCGTKNRQDPGWRYKGTHTTTQEQEDAAEERLTRYPSMRYALTLSRNTYECGNCRGDRNAPKVRDPTVDARHAAEIKFMLDMLSRRDTPSISEMMARPLNTTLPASLRTARPATSTTASSPPASIEPAIAHRDHADEKHHGNVKMSEVSNSGEDGSTSSNDASGSP